MALVYSATKGLSAMTLTLAHSRGWLDYDERVCTYWPEFALLRISIVWQLCSRVRSRRGNRERGRRITL